MKTCKKCILEQRSQKLEKSKPQKKIGGSTKEI